MRAAACILALVSLSGVVLIGRLAVASHVALAYERENFDALAKLSDRSPGSWTALHVLAAGCRCSLGVAEHLAARGPIAGVRESVVLIGNDGAITAQVHSSKLPLKVITQLAAGERYGIDGAPQFVLIAPDGAVKYAGGYTWRRTIGTGYEDVDIWRSISAGRAYQPLPVFGCAVSRRAKQAIDPLGLDRLNKGSTDDKL